MIDPTPRPSPQLRRFACIARWLWGAVLAIWLLLIGVWGVLHGVIVPRIGEWRTDVERLATDALGAPVRIARITAHADSWLLPTLELSQVQLLDGEGTAALALRKVVVTLSLRSVLRGGVEQLYIDAPDVTVQQQSDGRWQLAGLPQTAVGDADDQSLRWLLDQPEIVVQQGRLTVLHSVQSSQPWLLEDVQLVMRNGAWRHAIRLDAQPALTPHQPLHVSAVFKEPLLPSTQAPWERWTGQGYIEGDLAQWPAWIPFNAAQIQHLQGQGAWRAWLDVERGAIAGGAMDMHWPSVSVQWVNPAEPLLEVGQVHGRISGRYSAKGWSLQATQWGFGGTTGLYWPPSDWKVQVQGAAAESQQWTVQAPHIDITALVQLAQHVPQLSQWEAVVEQLQPKGHVADAKLVWTPQGRYQGQLKVRQLQWLAQPAQGNDGAGWPGVQGLDGYIEFSDRGGAAALTVSQGQLNFPGVFEAPDMAMDYLSAQLQWKIKDGRWQLSIPRMEFANADAQGHLQATWQPSEDATHPYPGVLDLQGVLSRANGAQVHRYLPLVIPATARHYVRDSVLAGEGRDVQFVVQGDLRHMPFGEPGQGTFRIEAPLTGVDYDYVPARLVSPGHLPWPGLRGLQGTLVFDGHSMQVRDARTGFHRTNALRMQSVQAEIGNLNHPVLNIQAQGRSALPDMLAFVQKSPVAGFTGHAFDSAISKGDADLHLKLHLPIDDLAHSRVQGELGFHGNSLQMTPHAPTLRNLQGKVHFSDQGFALSAVQSQALGGTWKLSGGMPDARAAMRIQAQGQATVDGLRADAALGYLAPVLRQATGQSSYTVEVTALDGAHAVRVTSDLRGTALGLPAPLHKKQELAWPLRVSTTTAASGMEEIQVTLGDSLSVAYQRDGSQQPARVLSGQIAWGVDAAAVPWKRHGVEAVVQLHQLDATAWQQAVSSPALPEGPATADALDYLPASWRVQVDELLVGSRSIPDVRAQLTHQRGSWQGQITSKQFGGHVDYQPPSVRHASGMLFARLDRVDIPRSAAGAASVDAGSGWDELEVLPALDIQVEELVIADKPLGQLRLQARNQAGAFGRDWLLERFDLQMPHAQWSAQGVWKKTAPQGPRTTQVQFALEIDSAGGLFDRLGMPGVLRQGQGQLAGHVQWQGPPLAPHWPSMQGAAHMDVTKGQFLKVEPGIGKLLSVLSLQSLPRRITLDFRDVFSQGFAFDFVRGDVQIDRGMASTTNLQMKGVNAAVLMEGQANLAQETQDLRVVVVPEINAMTASLAATAINPVVGVGSFVAQMLLRGPLMQAATRSFHVHGAWSDPVVEPWTAAAPVSPPVQSPSQVSP